MKTIFFSLISFCVSVLPCCGQDTLTNGKIDYKIAMSFAAGTIDISSVDKLPEQAQDAAGDIEVKFHDGLYKTIFKTKDGYLKTGIRNEVNKMTIELNYNMGKKTYRINYDTTAAGQILIQQIKLPVVDVVYYDSLYILHGLKVKRAIITDSKKAFATEVYYATELFLPQLSLAGKQQSGLYMLPGTGNIPNLIVKGKSVNTDGSGMSIDLNKIDSKTNIPLSEFEIPSGFENILN